MRKRNVDTDGKMAGSYFQQLITGISFGVTSGSITALGMIVGLDSATSSKLVVVIALVVMAVADGLADACGLHLATESEMEGGKSRYSSKEIWLTTAFTFLATCGVILTYAIPISLFPLEIAVPIDVAWGMLLLIIFNFYIAKIGKKRPIKIILEHILLAVFVIIISYWIGDFLAKLIG